MTSGQINPVLIPSAEDIRTHLPIVATAFASIVAVAAAEYHFGTGASVIAILGNLMLVVLWWATFVEYKKDQIGRVERDAEQARQAEHVKRALEQQNASAKLLVRRDLELFRVNEELRTLEQRKTDFITVATHQMRTPLSAVRWTLQMLAAGDVGPVNDEQKKFLQQAYDSNNRLIALLHDMLFADKIDSGNLSNLESSSDAVATIVDLVRELKPIAEQQGVTLQLETSGQKPVVALDAQHLRAVIQNLVENSVKYTPRGGTVTVAVTAHEKILTIIVKDTGIGIPEVARDRLFSRFFRAKNAVSMVTDGTGMGLYIAKRIVERYNGTITFTSTEGAGTTFTITLPCTL